MRRIFKHATAITLVGALVAISATPSDARGGRRAATAAAVGLGAGAVAGATAATIAGSGYYYGPGLGYGWPGYGYGPGFGYGAAWPGYGYGAGFGYGAAWPGYGYGSGYGYAPVYANAPVFPLLEPVVAAATLPIAAATAPFTASVAGPAATPGVYAYGAGYKSPTGQCWIDVDKDRGFGYFGACPAAPAAGRQAESARRNR